MRLTDEQAMTLIEWANESERDGGTTAFGPKFNAAMDVAKFVRDNARHCSGCRDVLGSKYRQAVPGKGDLCIPCWEEWIDGQSNSD